MGKTTAKKRKSAPAKRFTDATVCQVMVGGTWHTVDRGSWAVDLRGPFMHASWTDGLHKYSAFISQVQMVRHA